MLYGPKSMIHMIWFVSLSLSRECRKGRVVGNQSYFRTISKTLLFLSIYIDVQGMPFAMELLMSRVELKGFSYTACSKDPESNHFDRYTKYTICHILNVTNDCHYSRRFVEESIMAKCYCNYGLERVIGYDGETNQYIDIGNINIGFSLAAISV